MSWKKPAVEPEHQRLGRRPIEPDADPSVNGIRVDRLRSLFEGPFTRDASLFPTRYTARWNVSSDAGVTFQGTARTGEKFALHAGPRAIDRGVTPLGGRDERRRHVDPPLDGPCSQTGPAAP